MTFDRDRHTPFEELIGASLLGDLTADERRRLDAHLDTCATCRATLAAFSDQRRIMSGLRHLPVPRDLGARVRAGIEQEQSARPWWKRPPAIFAGVGGGLAVVAGALLAIVLLNNNPDDRDVGQASPTPSLPAASVSATAVPTLPPLETPAPTEQPASVAPSVSIEPAPTATPVQASPEPDSYLAVTGPPEDRAMALYDATSDESQGVETPPGVPIAAELSPDGQWIAYIVDMGLSGYTEIRATRIAEGEPSEAPHAEPPVNSPIPVGETVVLAESTAGGPFLEHLFWSPTSQYLAFTVLDREAGEGTDVWIFQPERGTASQATDVGNAYAGSWVPGGSGTSLLWISTAGATPESHLRIVHDSASPITLADPADSEFPAATNVFQPIVSPDSAFVIFWTGRMERSGDEWAFMEGGSPWIAENRQAGERGYEFSQNQALFSDLSIGRSAFASAAIRWSPNSNAFAVWNTAWTGVAEDYPDPTRVYLGRALDPEHVTRRHALDVTDLPEGAAVEDVKLSGTGRHLAITARKPASGDLSPPEAVLLLVTRNFEDVPDDTVTLGEGEGEWFGPAVYSAAEWAELIGD